MLGEELEPRAIWLLWKPWLGMHLPSLELCQKLAAPQILLLRQDSELFFFLKQGLALAPAGLELIILLPQLSKYGNFKCVTPPHLGNTFFYFPTHQGIITTHTVTFQLHNLHPLAFNILANKLQALLFQALFQDWIHLVGQKNSLCWPLHSFLCRVTEGADSHPHLKSVAVPLFQVVCVSIEFSCKKIGQFV